MSRIQELEKKVNEFKSRCKNLKATNAELTCDQEDRTKLKDKFRKLEEENDNFKKINTVAMDNNKGLIEDLAKSNEEVKRLSEALRKTDHIIQAYQETLMEKDSALTKEREDLRLANELKKSELETHAHENGRDDLLTRQRESRFTQLETSRMDHLEDFYDDRASVTNSINSEISAALNSTATFEVTKSGPLLADDQDTLTGGGGAGTAEENVKCKGKCKGEALKKAVDWNVTLIGVGGAGAHGSAVDPVVLIGLDPEEALELNPLRLPPALARARHPSEES